MRFDLLVLAPVVAVLAVVGCSRSGSEPLVAEIGSEEPPPLLVETTDVEQADADTESAETESAETESAETESAETESADTESADAVAGLVAASTVIFGGQSYGSTDGGNWDGHLSLWNDGRLSRLGPLFGGAWADAEFIYVVKADSGTVWIHNHDGAEVCSVQLDENETVHHATRRADGSVVLGVERWTEDDPIGRYLGFALDCETGERVAIEPMSQSLGDGEWVGIERIGGRVFEVRGDAEGNASVISNEAGIDLVGDDDWAGLIAFSPDGSLLAYGDHAGSFSPHVTSALKVRNAADGRLLWSAELPELISQLHFVGDALVVGQGADDGGWIPTDSVIAFDAATGTNWGSADAPRGLIYIG